MRLYWPRPNPPCEPKECLHCGDVIDGEQTDGWWLPKENWQGPDTYHLFCLSCCVDKMNAWPNHPNVVNEAQVREVLFEGSND